MESTSSIDRGGNHRRGDQVFSTSTSPPSCTVASLTQQWVTMMMMTQSLILLHSTRLVVRGGGSMVLAVMLVVGPPPSNQHPNNNGTPSYPINDPSPLLPIRGGTSHLYPQQQYIPRVGYSLYKTPLGVSLLDVSHWH